MLSRLWAVCVLLGGALLASGCSGFLKTAPVPESQDSLEQLGEIRQWSAARFVSELPVLEKNFSDDPSVGNRLRLAIALGFGECANCDPARAVELLQTLVASHTDGIEPELASLYLELLETRKMMAASQAQLLEQQRKLKKLQEKLEALTSIEESLHLREEDVGQVKE